MLAMRRAGGARSCKRQKPYDRQKKSRARCPSIWCAVTEGEAPNPRSSLARQSFWRYPSPRVGASLARDAPRARRSILQTPKPYDRQKKSRARCPSLWCAVTEGEAPNPRSSLARQSFLRYPSPRVGASLARDAPRGRRSILQTQKPYNRQKKSRARCPSLWCAVTEGEAPNPRSSLARQSFWRYPSPRVGASLARDAPRGRRSILQTPKPYDRQKKSRARCPSFWCAVTEGKAPNPRSSLARQSFWRYPSPRVGASLARDAPRGRRSILQTQKPYNRQKKSRARCPSLWCAVTEGEAPNPRSSLARQSFWRYPSPRVGASLARDAPRGRRSILQTPKPYNRQKNRGPGVPPSGAQLQREKHPTRDQASLVNPSCDTPRQSPRSPCHRPSAGSSPGTTAGRRRRESPVGAPAAQPQWPTPGP